MKYIKQKEVREDELPNKVFKDDKYKIEVVSGYMADLYVDIYYK